MANAINLSVHNKSNLLIKKLNINYMVYNSLECMRLVAAFILGDSSPGLLPTLENKFPKTKAIII